MTSGRRVGIVRVNSPTETKQRKILFFSVWQNEPSSNSAQGTMCGVWERPSRRACPYGVLTWMGTWRGATQGCTNGGDSFWGSLHGGRQAEPSTPHAPAHRVHGTFSSLLPLGFMYLCRAEMGCHKHCRNQKQSDYRLIKVPK